MHQCVNEKKKGLLLYGSSEVVDAQRQETLDSCEVDDLAEGEGLGCLLVDRRLQQRNGYRLHRGHDQPFDDLADYALLRRECLFREH